jgi:hypothetical protein
MPGKTPTGADMTLVSVADCDRLPTLKRMAARLAEQIDACDNAQNLDRLCARLQSVMGEVAELEVVASAGAADMIAARRNARRAGRAKGRRGASA